VTAIVAATDLDLGQVLIGTRRLFGFAHRNEAVALRDGGYTSDPAVLAQLARLVAINSARTEVDVIVTEIGAAELKGRSLAERARRLVAIAHPALRDDLEREARSIQQRGY
jgi:acyl-CoA hydrolase